MNRRQPRRSTIISSTRIARLAIALSLALIALLAPSGQAAAAEGKYISDYDDAGYVDVTDIQMSGSTFSFTATITATRGSLAVNPLYWSAKAADGTMYSSPDYSSTTLGSGSLPAGERARGTVAFDIDGPRPTLIAYEGALGDRLATWSITWRKPKPSPRQTSPFGS
ncbi:hypothetical protein GCM10010528_04290 [Gordonia defluvii]|uniref:MPT63-like domain-containing protein n=1 Tax=Gordonia defluvii TaxID=283718 RepID=A0ABP6KZL1_9ACTN